MDARGVLKWILWGMYQINLRYKLNSSDGSFVIVFSGWRCGNSTIVMLVLSRICFLMCSQSPPANPQPILAGTYAGWLSCFARWSKRVSASINLFSSV